MIKRGLTSMQRRPTSDKTFLSYAEGSAKHGGASGRSRFPAPAAATMGAATPHPLQKHYLTILIKLSKLCSSQGGVALRRGVVNTGILATEGFPGAPGACRKTGTSKTFAAMAEVPLSKSRPFVLAG